MTNNSRQKRTPKPKTKNNSGKNTSQNRHDTGSGRRPNFDDDNDDDDKNYNRDDEVGPFVGSYSVDFTEDDIEYLSDEHTIAGNGDGSESNVSLLEEDVAGLDGAGGTDNDVILEGRRFDGRNAESAESAALRRLQKLYDCIGLLSEFTSEKRSSKREAILRRLFRSVANHATGYSGQDMLDSNSDVIRQCCFHSIRIGPPSEQYAACRVLEAVSTVLGSDHESWYESLEKQLRRTASNNIATPVRCAALRALCMSVCMNSDDTHDTESLMDHCETFIVGGDGKRMAQVPPSVRATAIDCWTLLASTIDDYYVAGQDEEIIGRGLVLLPVLKQCLDTIEASTASLREAAGECMALIHEARMNIGMLESSNNDQGGNMVTNLTTRKYQRGSWENSQWEVVITEIMLRLEELSNQTGHYMSKQAKKKQRKTFREYMSTVCDNEGPPDETLYFGNSSSFTLSTWKEIIQLEFVRHCFQSGFQIQLLTNATLQAMFGFNPSSSDVSTSTSTTSALSSLEKRLLLSKTSEVSKLADKKLNKERRKRQNVKNHFLTVDGDAI